jgi:hypothetical protein
MSRPCDDGYTWDDETLRYDDIVTICESLHCYLNRGVTSTFPLPHLESKYVSKCKSSFGPS